MNQEPMDLETTTGSIQPKAYHYKVKIDTDQEPIFVTVIALNATSARQGLAHQFAGKAINYYGCSSHIIQVNG